MNLDLQRLSLRKQAISIFVGFVVLASINFFVISHYQKALRVASKEIEAAKDLQILPRQLSSDCQLYLKGNPAIRSSIGEIAEQYESSLEFFNSHDIEELSSDNDNETDTLMLGRKSLIQKINKQWGNTRVQLNHILFEPATIDTIVQESKEVPLYDSLNTITTEVTQKSLSLSNPKIERAANYVNSSSLDLSKLGKRLLIGQKKYYRDKSESLTYASLLFLGLIILAAVSAYYFIRKMMLKPIQQLGAVVSDMSNGNMSKKSTYKANNELGLISQSINKISDNLRNATAFVNAIENGKLDEEFIGIEEKDVSSNGLEGALLTMRDQMKTVEKQDFERKWSTGGLAKFVDILRSSNDDVYSLSDVIISNLVDYTKSNQGGIFIINEEDEDNKFLELISLYAFDSKKYDKKSYRLGEGLVGQTYLERKTTYLLEVPQEYVSIISGLGGANPKSILLVPLKINEVIYGIIELASFNEYQPYEIEFVEKLAESIAATIASVKNNQRTKSLLAESQALTEQMQAQEEEMRQNMEEISATQEEMSRKEVEMSAQLTAINTSLSSAEFDLNEKLITANNNYIKAHGYHHMDELRGKSFSALSVGNQRVLWAELKKGASQSGHYKKIKKSGEEFLVLATYTPVKNEIGDYYKVIELVLSTEVSDGAGNEGWEGIKEVEEALRLNMDALTITQEQLDKKLKISELTLNALDNVIKIITLSLEGEIININSLAASIVGVDATTIKGENISEVFDEELYAAGIPKNESGKVLTIKTASGKGQILAEIRHESESDQVYIIWI